MRRVVLISVAVCALVVVCAFAWPLAAQSRPVPAPRPNALLLEGPGSEIGVTVRDPRADEIKAAKLSQPGGALLQDVRAGSAGAKAGLATGDIVVEFDGERVRSARHFTRLVRETPPGRTVRSIVVRDGARRTIDVTPEQGDRLSMTLPDFGPEIERRLRNLPRNFNFDLPPQAFDVPFGGRSARGRLGVGLVSLTDQLASYFGVKEGVLVSSVETDSPAARAGIRAGDVIASVNGRSVQSAADATRALRDVQTGASIDVRFFRDKKEMTVQVMLRDPDDPRGDRLLPV
jgi:S1-C subfamily serine protease